MRKLIFLLLLSIVCILLYTFTQMKRIKRKGDVNPAIVSSVISVDQSILIKAVINTFRENRPPPPSKFSHFSLAQAGEENFPAEYQLAYYNDEESVANYLSIAGEKRKHDFYLYDFSDADNRRSYWVSEYSQGEEPVLFRCNFLIHHEPNGPAATRVDILELIPRVWVGKKFAFERHGPGYFLDIKDVAPTTSDRVELLDLIKEVVARQ